MANTPVVDKTAAERSKALAEADLEAEEIQLDETEPGGRYVVDGFLKNADGEVLGQAPSGTQPKPRATARRGARAQSNPSPGDEETEQQPGSPPLPPGDGPPEPPTE